MIKNVRRLLFKVVLFLSFFFFFSYSAFSQKLGDAQIYIENVKGIDEIANYGVVDACLDSNQYLWVLGSQSLSRYDGARFQRVYHKDDKADYNLRFFKDDFGRIWIIKFSGRLFYISGERLIAYKYNHLVESDIYRGHFESMRFDRDSVLHIGSRGKGYMKIYKNGHKETVIGQNEGFCGIALVDYKGGMPFTFSSCSRSRGLEEPNRSLYYFDQNMSLRYEYNISNFGTQAHLSALSKFNDGSLLLSLGSKVYLHLDDRKVRRLERHTSPIISSFVDSEDGIWLGTEDEGIHRLDSLNQEEAEVYLPKETAAILCHSPENGLWLKSDSLLLGYMPNIHQRQLNLKGLGNGDRIGHSAGNREKRFIVSHKGLINVLMENGLVKTLTKPFKSKDNPLDERVQRVLYDSINDRFWVGSRRYMRFLSNEEWHMPKSESYMHPSGSMGDFEYSERSDAIYSTMNLSVVKLTTDSLLNTFERIVEKRIWSLYLHTDSSLYIGTAGGLYHVENGDSTARKFDSELLQSTIHDIFWYEHRIWLVFEDRLGYLDCQGEVKLVPDVFLLDVFRHASDGFWIAASEDQLIHLQMDEKENIQLTRYAQGNLNTIYGRDCSFQWDSLICLCTDQGLQMVELPEAGVMSNYLHLNIDKVMVNSRAVAFASQYSLNYQENYLQLNYSAAHYHLNGRTIEYRYKMKGLNDRWYNTNERFAQFTDLDPGNYTFVLQAKTEDSLSFNTVKKVHFKIEPPFWVTWWFRTIVVAVILSIILLLFRYQLRLQKRKDQLVIDKLLAEQRAFRAQLNPHFLFNSLSSIQHLVFSEDRMVATENISAFAKLMRQVLKLSQKEWITLKEELDVLKLYLKLELLRFDGNLEYHFKVSDHLLPSEIYIPPLLLQPILENAIKHGLLKKADLGGRIEIVIDEEEGFVLIDVIDNGVGFKATEETSDQAHVSFGLSAIKKRLELMNTAHKVNISLTVQDLKTSSGKTGTCVRLSFPFSKVMRKPLIANKR